MKFLLAMVGMVASSISVAATNESDVSSVLNSLSGFYSFESNDKNQPCYPIAPQFSQTDQFRVLVENNAGVETLRFERYATDTTTDNGEKGQWYKVFDEPYFFAIGAGTSRSWVPGTNLYISHLTTVETTRNAIVHTASITEVLGGSVVGIQTLSLDSSTGLLTYSATLETDSAFGGVLHREPAGLCTFRKRP